MASVEARLSNGSVAGKPEMIGTKVVPSLKLSSRNLYVGVFRDDDRFETTLKRNHGASGLCPSGVDLPRSEQERDSSC